jgi:pimeloyl-ACP methyl ester carboxylesterase
MNPDPSIGERIRARRLIRGWSVRHAADRAGVSHATWSRIERGRQAADNRFMLADVAAALECSPADLAGVPVPCLVLQCSADAIAPMPVGEFVDRTLPDSSLVVLRATGHCPNLSAPDETVAAMRAFL